MAISAQELLTLQIKKDNGINLTREEKLILKENSAEEKAKKKGMSFGERMKHASKSEFSQLMGDNEIDNFPIRDWIDTGNVLLNAQIAADGKRGMPSGRVWQLAGESSVGKSYLGLEALKNAQKLGYFAILYDTEMANNDKEALKGRGIDTENLLYIPIDTVENLKTSMLNILEETKVTDKVFIMVDSIGNLSTRKELEDSIEGLATKDMTRPAQLKALFRTVTLKAGIKNVPVIIVNHVYASMSMFSGNVISGGGGSMYNSSIISTFSKAQEKGADGRMSGALITSTVTKCRTAIEKSKVKFTIDFENGLTKWSGMDQFCLDEKLLTRSGRGYMINSNMVGSFMKDEKIASLTDEFWEKFADNFLYQFLSNKFKYQSVAEELGIDDNDAEDID